VLSAGESSFNRVDFLGTVPISLTLLFPPGCIRRGSFTDLWIFFFSLFQIKPTCDPLVPSLFFFPLSVFPVERIRAANFPQPQSSFFLILLGLPCTEFTTLFVLDLRETFSPLPSFSLPCVFSLLFSGDTSLYGFVPPPMLPFGLVFITNTLFDKTC